MAKSKVVAFPPSVIMLIMLRLALLLASLSSVHGASFDSWRDEGRIINGTEVPPGKYPSQVSLQKKNYHVCGGSILNKKFVLTAAHCVASAASKEELRVVTASVDLRKANRRYKVDKIIIHENYFADDLHINDIALLKMLSPFKMSGGEAAVRLASRNQVIQSGTRATTIGWGLTSDCSDVIGQIYSTQICSIFPGYGKGVCEGDSGGPIFSSGRQVGVVSWRDGSAPCGAAPAVYTNLAKYSSWITRNAQ